MAWSDPKREHRSVRDGDQHIGYFTIIRYPNRDIAAFPEGTPYYEVVIAGLGERHVALLQRFKEHWLIHCGDRYETANRGGELTDEQVATLARFGLGFPDQDPAALARAIQEYLQNELGE